MLIPTKFLLSPYIRTETIPFDRSMTTESGFTTRCDKSTALSATESHSS